MRLRSCSRAVATWLRAAEQAGEIVLSVGEVAVLALGGAPRAARGARSASAWSPRRAASPSSRSPPPSPWAPRSSATIARSRSALPPTPEWRMLRPPRNGPALAPLRPWPDGARDRDRGFLRDRLRGRRQVAPGPPVDRARSGGGPDQPPGGRSRGAAGGPRRDHLRGRQGHPARRLLGPACVRGHARRQRPPARGPPARRTRGPAAHARRDGSRSAGRRGGHAFRPRGGSGAEGAAT